MQTHMKWMKYFALVGLTISQVSWAGINYSYVYDSLDRLTKASDSLGNAIDYSYDDVGNVLDISRSQLGALAILSVSPASGAVGTQIGLQGQGFSLVTSENTVTFNGTPATVVSATADKLLVTVPSGATSGPITVSVGSASAVTSTSFVVETVPQITSISPKFVLAGASIPALVIVGQNLSGAVLTFTPTLTPPPITVGSTTIAADGASATLAVSVSTEAIGSFIVVASTTAGESDTFGSSTNTLTVLGSASADADGDGLSNGQEIAQGTDPTRSDTDGDGLSDGFEMNNGFDPLLAGEQTQDPDGDNLDNLAEFAASTDPNNPDSDADGLSDGAEVLTYGTTPTQRDTDSGGRSDGDEVLRDGTDPLSASDDLGPKLVSNSAGVIDQPMTAADHNGNLHVVWVDNRTGGQEIFYSMLSATGSVLIDDTRLSGFTGLTLSHRPAIAVDSQNHVHIVWAGNHPGGSSVFNTILDPYLDDLDGSPAIESAISLVDDRIISDVANSADNPRLAISRQDKVHIVWTSNSDTVTYMQLDETGSTRIPERPVAVSTSFIIPLLPSVAVDSANNAHIVWQDGTINSNSEVFYAMLNGTTGGTLIDTSRLTPDDGFDSGMPEIAVNTNDDVTVVFQDERLMASVGTEIFMLRLTPSVDDQNGNSANVGAITSLTNTLISPNEGISSNSPAIAVDAKGQLQVSYFDTPQDPNMSQVFDSNLILVTFMPDSTQVGARQVLSSHALSGYDNNGNRLVSASQGFIAVNGPSRYIAWQENAPGNLQVALQIIDADSDHDGISNAQEIQIGTNVNNPDSDNDGLLDGFEINAGINPLQAGEQTLDADNDGLSNLAEQTAGTDPGNPDSDGDGLSDGAEMTAGSNPLRTDSDGDGVSDGDEVNLFGSDPTLVDSDNDTFDDGYEVRLGADPSNPANSPGQALYGAAGIPGGPSRLYKLDQATGTATLIGPIGFDRVEGMDFDSFGRLYAVGNNPVTGVQVLISIDPETGVGTEIGATGAAALGLSSITGLSIRDLDDRLYVQSGNFGSVATINPVTGAAALLPLDASAGSSDDESGIAFLSVNEFFRAGFSSLETVNAYTGDSNGFTSLQFPPQANNSPRINALDISRTGVLYGSLDDDDGAGNVPENYLTTLDPTTGTITIIGHTVNGLKALAWGPSFDRDGDSLSDSAELAAGTDPDNPDTDADGLLDGFEVNNGFNPLVAGEQTMDPDADGLSNLNEQIAATNPNIPDSDSDGLSDGQEVNVLGTDPSLRDTDGGGRNDGNEVNIDGTDPLAAADDVSLLLYSVTRDDTLLRTINPSNAATISSIPISLVGTTVYGATGLAIHPVTRQLWAVLEIDDGSGITTHVLVTINPNTGIASQVGTASGEYFAGLAFDDTGRLFATADPFNSPNAPALFEFNTTDGTPTLLCSFTQGDEEVIAFDSDTDARRLFSLSGSTTIGPKALLESINSTAASTCTVNNTLLSGGPVADQAAALTFSDDSGVFFSADTSAGLFSLATDGFLTPLGVLDHTPKGLAFGP